MVRFKVRPKLGESRLACSEGAMRLRRTEDIVQRFALIRPAVSMPRNVCNIIAGSHPARLLD
jgi:hypothetical protein